MNKIEILKKAITTVKDRTDTHGADLKTHFAHVAKLWSAYLVITVSPADVAAMLQLLKMSRANMGDPRVEDHYVDMAGYAAIMGELNSDK